ncbi:hypothetical protein [Nocardioides ferulae]|uniref:hypothetical protein n=1 Tax=Nocardioides ferulae TaxID=2340821 RepID=UPI0013DE27D8|nr:hypothetical protein [Nocardioides ferulae]
MARGPKLQLLAQAVDPIEPAEVSGAGNEWDRGATVLENLAQQLQSRAAALRDHEYYQGQTAQATVDALVRSATHLRDKRDDMVKGRDSLGRASDALQAARQTYQRLAKEADAAVEPTKERVVGPPNDAAVVAADTKYTNDMLAFRAAEQAREAEAEAALRTLETNQRQESAVMQTIHGEPDPWEQPVDTGGGSGGGGRGPVSTGPRGPVPVPGNPTSHPPGNPPTEPPTSPPTNPPTNPPTTPPTNPPTTPPTSPPTTPPSTGTPQGPTAPPVGTPHPGSGTIGSPVAPAASGGGGLGSVGGGVAAGAGIGLAGLGGLAGGATGIGGGAMPIGGGAGAAGQGRAIGAGGARGASGVLGRGTAVPMTQGAAGGARGAAAGGRSGSTGRAGGRSGAAGAAGGRGAAAAGAGGRGAGGRGAGGRGAAGGAAGAGRGRKGRDDERGQSQDFYDDGSDWIDDEGIGPDVLR